MFVFTRLRLLNVIQKRRIQTISREFQQFDGGNVDLLLDNNSGIAYLTLNNPKRKNAISGKMMSQLSRKIQQLYDWPQGKAVIILGENDFFCSGGDLTTVRRIADPDNGRKMSLLMHDNCTRLQSLPLISLAFIQGLALGGGAEIATSCDFRLLTTSARMGFVHIRIGIVSAWGGGTRLAQLIGPQKALDLMLSGRMIDLKECQEIGLADGMANNLLEAEEWIKKYTFGGLDSIHAIKRIINGFRYLSLEMALKNEIENSISVWGGNDHKKGLNDKIKHN